MNLRIAFLDDDPVIRIARLILTVQTHDPWIGNYFAPEQVDLSRLSRAARGISQSDGAEIRLAAENGAAAEGANIIVFRRGNVTANLMHASPQLRLIQRLGERPEGIDLLAASRRGIWVSCVPRRTLHYTAEHTVLLMLALTKRLLHADRAVREAQFDSSRVHPIDDTAYNWAAIEDIAGLHGKTVGLIGLGEVGTLVARLARAFGMQVLYNKRSRAPAEEERALGAQYAALEEMLERADFVSLHAANLPENDKLVGSNLFTAMQRSAFFVNTSRGRLVDEDSLYEALVSGTIAGAGLDVHRIEPRPRGDRFASLPNVILTPHIAGGARSGVLEELQVIIENCQAARRGDPPRFLVQG